MRGGDAYGTITAPQLLQLTLRQGLALPLEQANMITNLLDRLPPMVMLDMPPDTLPDHIEAYCVKCKHAHQMVSPQLVTTKNGKSAARGKCAVCGTTVMKFLPCR